MTKSRVVFMGTPDFAVPCLQSLLDEGCNLKAVVTQPDRPKGRGQKLTASPVKELALSYRLPLLQPEKINNAEFLEKITELKPDIIVVVAFGQILPATLLRLPPLGCVNVHASLLPQYRGAAPIHWAVINGESLSGITTMYMDTGLDTGDMILKNPTPIGPDDTCGTLHDQLKDLGAQVLRDTLRLIENGQAPRLAQDHNLATYAPKLTRELEKIDWRKSALEIHNLTRGLNPWPLAYTLHQDKALKIRRTRIHSPRGASQRPGRIAALTLDGFLAETGEGVLEILEVQPQSKRQMGADEYARGYFLKAGDILN